jgi:hypothetical protein
MSAGVAVAVDGEAADEPFPQLAGEKFDEGRYLIRAADDEKVEAPAPEQLLRLADESPVVPLAQPVRLVADPVLGEPLGVVRPAQRPLADRLQLPGLVEVVLPHLAGPLVHDDRAGAVVLVEHAQHRTNVRIGVHHDVAGASRQPHVLIDAVAVASEDGHSARFAGLLAERFLDLRDVLAEREPRAVLKRAVLRERPDAVQQGSPPGS